MTVGDVIQKAAPELFDDEKKPYQLILQGQQLDHKLNFASLKPGQNHLLMVESEPSQHDYQPKSTVSVKSQTGNKVITVTYDLATATVGDVRKSAAEQLSIESGTQTQLVLVLEDKTRFKTLDNKNVFEIVEKLSKQSSASAKTTPKKLSPRKRKSSSPRKRKSSSPGKRKSSSPGK
jgi:hypothetical protein